ncbi:MAG: UDP-N-acetylmuramoyl-tripeptide--D-alanyl-D-alanine ligase [Gammaproteobacteria bacterium]|nr:UDP-N-acetylmuramoyl-tripeptide--D-alanyl-D-alanine ligase [Gammaproteobacteria bacterium]
MMLLSQAATAVNGQLIGQDSLFTAVSKDSRDLDAGSLYVAIRGERFDGHAFVDQAQDAGAAGALVSEQQQVDLPQIRVDDTRLALGALAAYWRQQYNGKIVGITGSNGKTSVKEMTRSILEQAAGAEHVLSTAGNLNNDIGMPITLLRLRGQHRFAVIEMGANHPGEIEYLTHIAQPHVAVINNAGPAHLEGFGSIEKVASSKAEIYSGVVHGGTAVINADDDYADYWRGVCAQLGGDKNLITFSMQDASADLYANPLDADKTATIELKTPRGNGVVELMVPGTHNIMNALAAAAVTSALEIDLEDIIAGLAAFEGVSGRLAYCCTASGAKIINDTYNANPSSLKAAMQVLADSGDDTWLVLGDMAELGDEQVELHRQVGEQARSLGVKHLLATGDLASHAVESFGEGAAFFADRGQLVEQLQRRISEQSVVLVKGSRSMRMEQIVDALLDRPEAQGVR